MIGFWPVFFLSSVLSAAVMQVIKDEPATEPQVEEVKESNDVQD